MCIVCYVTCGHLLLSSLIEKINKKHKGDIARREKRENKKGGSTRNISSETIHDRDGLYVISFFPLSHDQTNASTSHSHHTVSRDCSNGHLR